MKKIKLNKKLFLNKDVVSNLNGVRGGGVITLVPTDVYMTGRNDVCVLSKNWCYSFDCSQDWCRTDIIMCGTGLSVCDCPPTDDCINA